MKPEGLLPVEAYDFRAGHDAVQAALASVATKGIGVLDNALNLTDEESAAVRRFMLSGIMTLAPVAALPAEVHDPVTNGLSALNTALSPFISDENDASNPELKLNLAEIRRRMAPDENTHKDQSFIGQGLRIISVLGGVESSLLVAAGTADTSVHPLGKNHEFLPDRPLFIADYHPNRVLLLPQDKKDGMPVLVDSEVHHIEHPAHMGLQSYYPPRDMIVADFVLPEGASFQGLGVTADELRLHPAAQSVAAIN